MYTLGVPNVNELIHLLNHHIDGQGLTVMIGPRPKRLTLRTPERTMLQMLGAHIKAGYRLRRRLRESLDAVAPSADGAVLDASARMLHAEGEARNDDVRQLLEHTARAIDRARTREQRQHHDKLIAYHLGIPEGSASAHLARALRKLGMSSRVELVRTLGRYYPQPSPARRGRSS